MRGPRCSLVLATFVPLAIALVESGHGLVNGNKNSTVVAESANSSDSYPLSWISDLFYLALANYTVRDVGSTACRTQSAMYEQNLKNYTEWAVQMAESWERRPIGILGGNKYHMGVYDECVNVHYPIRGQYCLTEIKLIPLNKNNNKFNDTKVSADFNINNNAWNTILEWVDNPNKVQRNILNLGICIPDSCSALDLETSLQKDLDMVFSPEGVKPVVKIDPLLCTVSGDMYPYNTSFYVTCAFFIFLVLLCSSVTIFHFIELSRNRNKEENSTSCNSFFYKFSFISSGKELLSYNKDNELNFINGIKVLVMVLILFGHRSMILFANPMNYTKVPENLFIYGPSIILVNLNIADPFFFISGFIMYMTISPVFIKKGPLWIKILSPIIYRLFRMLPAYCAMMALVAHILPHLGDGPLWTQKRWIEAENCKNYWWTNLLFINSFIDSKYQCLLMSWYISCDIQFFVIGVIFVYLYTKNVKFSIWLLSLSLGISILVPFIITYFKRTYGMFITPFPVMENPRNSSIFNNYYRPSYMRATPFFGGMAVGFAVKYLKENKIKFTNKTVYSVTFIVVTICLWIQCYGAIFYDHQRPYYALEHALYALFSHCTYTIIGVCVFIFQFTVGYGLLSKIFDNRFMVLLGRLSYSVLLVNIDVITTTQSSQRLPTDMSVKTVLYSWINEAFKSYIMGLALYLVVEAPFSNLTRILFGRGQKKTSPTTMEMQNVKTINIEINN